MAKILYDITHRKDLKIVARNNWGLLVGLVIFWSIMIGMLIYSFTLNHGHIIYSLDDAYIHMAIAKNFSQHGIWGITNNEFSSSSSSILYTLLLSLIFLFGPNEIAPLIINLIFANLLIFEVYYILKEKINLPPYATFSCLILMIIFIPLPFLIFTGMEHVIQIFLNILFVYLVSTILSNPDIQDRKPFSSNEKGILLSKQDRLLFIVTPLITMVRFEGMFLIVAVSGLFLLRKKYFYSVLIAGLGFLPIIIYGLISMSFGWFFFPNSVILKGNSLDFTTIEGILVFLNPKIVVKSYYILILLFGATTLIFIQYYKNKKIWNSISIFSLIFIFVALLHLLFIGAYIENQNLSRYDGYLTALGIMLFFISLKDYIPNHLSINYIRIFISNIGGNSKINLIKLFAILFIVISFFFLYIPRTIYLLRRTPQASNNIYEQQYQMGLFLKKYYEGECVALNDIGAANYEADIECLDLRGLGSQEIAKSIINEELDEEVVYKAAKKRDCKIAIIYEDKDYGYDIPSQWLKVGEWKLEYNVVCGDDTVSFWAVDPDEVEDLIKNLQDFSKHLPRTVIESGNYTE